MNFSAPATQEQLDAILSVCRLTDFGPHGSAMINNAWRTHVDPRADECGSGCSKTLERHRMIVSIATQRMGQWQDALAQKDLDDFKSDYTPPPATKKTKKKTNEK